MGTIGVINTLVIIIKLHTIVLIRNRLGMTREETFPSKYHASCHANKLLHTGNIVKKI